MARNATFHRRTDAIRFAQMSLCESIAVSTLTARIVVVNDSVPGPPEWPAHELGPAPA
jgi:hypothetical protein